MKPPYELDKGGARLFVRATPKAARDSVQITAAGGERQQILVKVRAAPEDGKANAAVLHVLAECFDWPVSALSLTQGLHSRNKTIYVQGAPESIVQSILAWAEEQDQK